MIYTFIAERCSDLPISVCCRVMGVSTSGYYQRRAVPVTDRELAEAHRGQHGVRHLEDVPALLRHAASPREAISQAELAGRLDVTQGAISKLEHSEDVRVSTLRQYLEALGARLELVAVFDEDDCRVSVHLGKGTAA